MKPLVSVIIPTYNRQALLKETVSSVLNQTHENVECIVVDDGSTDDSAQMVATWASSEKRLKLVYNTKTKGAQGARNTGLAEAKGE
jgi:glycosyltransferase involved in cell wall biosynthesis